MAKTWQLKQLVQKLFIPVMAFNKLAAYFTSANSINRLDHFYPRELNNFIHLYQLLTDFKTFYPNARKT